jgi:hypothetical protein
VVQRLIRDGRDLTVVGLEDDRGLVRVAGDEIPVKAVVRRIEFAVLEPSVERSILIVKNPREWTTPGQMLAGKTRLEGFIVACGFSHECAVGIHSVNGGMPC